MSKYREPWSLFEAECGERSFLFLQSICAAAEFDEIIASEDSRNARPLPRAEVARLMKRAKECVNACIGMREPAEDIAKLRSENERMRSELDEVEGGDDR